MKKILVLSLAAGVAAAAANGQQSSARAGQSNSTAAPSSGDLNMQRYKMALSDARKKLFAAGMSDLTPQQLESFWAVYADFEKEKNAITTARLDLAKKYADNFQNVSDAEITSLLTDSANLQKKAVDLRMKYYGDHEGEDQRPRGRPLRAHRRLHDDGRAPESANQLPIPTGEPAPSPRSTMFGAAFAALRPPAGARGAPESRRAPRPARPPRGRGAAGAPAPIPSRIPAARA